MNREDITKYLSNNSNIGIELGVAEGEFSKKLLETQKFKYLYSVDRYSGEGGVTETTLNLAHDVNQYIRALRLLKTYESKNTLLRMDFNNALQLFEDDTFDFIYIDGYAHTGQDEGSTLYDWYPKLKSGGMFAGDDYHTDWNKVIHYVDEFCSEKGLKLNIHDYKNKNNVYSSYPSWYVFKE